MELEAVGSRSWDNMKRRGEYKETMKIFSVFIISFFVFFVSSVPVTATLLNFEGSGYIDNTYGNFVDDANVTLWSSMEPPYCSIKGGPNPAYDLTDEEGQWEIVIGDVSLSDDYCKLGMNVSKEGYYDNKSNITVYSDQAVYTGINRTLEHKSNFQVDITSPSDGDVFVEGEEVEVSFEIQNTGETEGTQDIKFYVDDELEGTEEEVSIGEGEDYDSEFLWEADSTGVFTLLVQSYDDSDSINVNAEEKDWNVEADGPTDGSVSEDGEHTFDFTVENTGNVEDTYSITGSDTEGWFESIDTDSVTLEPGDVKIITMTIEIPYEDGGKTSTMELIADGESTDSHSFELTYEEDYDVEVEAPVDDVVDEHGEHVYNFIVENTGNIEDTYSITVSDGKEWVEEYEYEDQDLTLGSGESESVEVTLNIPYEEGGKDSDITLEASGEASGEDTFNVEYKSEYGVSVEAEEDSVVETEHGTKYYNFTVENTGNVEDTYELFLYDEEGWSVGVDPDQVSVGVGEVETVEVEVDIPHDAGGVTETVTLEAESLGNDVSDDDSMDITLEEDYGVNVTAPEDDVVEDHGKHSYNFTVENTGNVWDEYEITIVDDLGWLEINYQIDLDPSEESKEEVTIDIPYEDGGMDNDITLTAESKHSDVSDEDTFNVHYLANYDVFVDGPEDQSIDEEGEYVFEFTVNNTGNIADSYDITAGDDEGWYVEHSPDSVDLDPLEEKVVTVTVDVPYEDGGESSEIWVEASSDEAEDDHSFVLSWPEEYELKIEKIKAGEGKIFVDSLEKDLPYNKSFLEGTTVEINATPENDWSFSHWIGDYPENGQFNDTINITMDSDKTLRAYFQDVNESINHTLSIDIVGEGETDPEKGNHTYHHGELVPVKAYPEYCWIFEEWTGDIMEHYDGNETEITVNMSKDREIVANFTKSPDCHSLTIDIEGDGETVPEEGTHLYQSGEIVDLEAVPDSGWEFDKWTGDYQGTDKTISIEMDSDKIITAHFKEEDDPSTGRRRRRPPAVVPDPKPSLEVDVDEIYIILEICEYHNTSFDITNKGEADDTVTLAVEDVQELLEIEEDEYKIPANGTTTVKMSAKAPEGTEPGKYEGSVLAEGQEDEFEIPVTLKVLEPEPDIQITDVDVDIKRKEPPAEVLVTYTVKNLGKVEGTREITITVDTEKIFSGKHELDVNKTETISVPHTLEEAGKYVFKVNGEERTVEIPEPDPVPGITARILERSVELLMESLP